VKNALQFLENNIYFDNKNIYKSKILELLNKLIDKIKFNYRISLSEKDTKFIELNENNLILYTYIDPK